jgi:iron complex outermembrane receptor protein
MVLHTEVLETFKRNIKCIFIRIKAVANFGYDQLSGRSYGGTGANFLNGIKGSGHNNTYENTGSRFNKVMDLYLNYNKKVDAIDTN